MRVCVNDTLVACDLLIREIDASSGHADVSVTSSGQAVTVDDFTLTSG